MIHCSANKTWVAYVWCFYIRVCLCLGESVYVRVQGACSGTPPSWPVSLILLFITGSVSSMTMKDPGRLDYRRFPRGRWETIVRCSAEVLWIFLFSFYGAMCCICRQMRTRPSVVLVFCLAPPEWFGSVSFLTISPQNRVSGFWSHHMVFRSRGSLPVQLSWHFYEFKFFLSI